MSGYKQKEMDKLIESEKNCQVILENIPVSIAFLDKDFCFIKVNKLHEEWSGLPESELLGKHCYDIVGQYKDDPVRKGHDRICSSCGTILAKETGKIQKYVREYKNSTLEVTTVPVFNSKGEVYRFIEIVRDITSYVKKRKHIEKMLKESEEKHYHVLEKSSDGIFIAQDNVFKLTNPKFREIVGYTEDELSEMNYFELVIPQYREHIKKLYDEVADGKVCVQRLENELIGKNMKKINVELTTVPINYDGRFATLAIIRDVTERKRYLQEIESRKRYLESLLKSIRDVVISTDDDRNIISCNDAVKEVFGYSRQELIGKPFRILRSEEHRMKSIQQGSPVLKALRESEYYFDDNYVFKKKNGEIFPASFSTSVIRDNNRNPIGLVGIIRDETKRKLVDRALSESEERYRKIVENSSDLIWIIDFSGKVNYSNRACAEKLGYDLKGEKEVMYFVHPDDCNQLKENLDRLLKDDRPCRNVTCRFKSYDGRWLDLIINAEKISLGGNEYIQSVARDISEIRETERLKSEFIANVSHELRTPLNAILGYTGIMLKSKVGAINQEQEKQLKLVKSNSQKLLTLINDLLDLSIIESGKMSLTLEKFWIRDVVEDVVDGFKPALDARGLHINSSVENIEIYNDRTKVMQILTNLVDNAIKYTEKGSVNITARYTDNYRLAMMVSDTGIGIKKEDMKRMFQAFQQLDGSTTRKYGGVGIGLHLTKKLSEFIGGKIEVDSEPGVGSIFTVIIPIIFKGGAPFILGKHEKVTES
jgi:PAS domain S-box-containing protein